MMAFSSLSASSATNDFVTAQLLLPRNYTVLEGEILKQAAIQLDMPLTKMMEEYHRFNVTIELSGSVYIVTVSPQDGGGPMVASVEDNF